MVDDFAGWRMDRAGDNVLFLVGFGSWTAEVARSFSREFRSCIEDFDGRDWALLGDATDWNLNDDRVQDILRDENRRAVRGGCRAGSFYTGAGALNRLLLYRLVEPDSDRFHFRVHPHRSRAVDALAERGFSLTDRQLQTFFRGEGTRA